MRRNYYFGRTEEDEEEEEVNEEDDEEVSTEALYEIKRGLENEIDNFMRGIGISNPRQFTNENGWRVLKRGSALIFVGVTIDDDIVSLRAFSKIMDLPSDKELILPLMRELLEINTVLPNECRFAISNNSVIATTSKWINDYDESLIPLCLHVISRIADDYDDYFIEKYGGTSKSRK